jgi:predicted deacetylase
VKDTVTQYWLNYKMATIEFGDTENRDHVLKSKFAIVTIHDVCPAYSSRIFTAADALEKLDIPFNFAIIPRFKQKDENAITNNIKWLERIMEYNQPIALHGLYHEDQDGKIEDFHNFDLKKAQEDLKKGIDIFVEAGITSNIFIPPTWAVNKYTIDAMLYMGFSLAETDEEILLLKRNTRLHTDILNWDAGPEKLSKIFQKINRRHYKEKVMNNSQMIRMAIHPRDPEHALDDQMEMIQGLKDINYNFLVYNDVLQLFG